MVIDKIYTSAKYLNITERERRKYQKPKNKLYIKKYHNVIVELVQKSEHHY